MSIESIFLGAVELSSTADREKYLDEQCGSNAALRADVESLLASHQRAGDFLRDPPRMEQPTTMRSRVSERPGAVIGHYKLLQEIGEGGFGIVFMAEQQHPVRRKVALKIIKPGMDSKEVIARFEAERQALAMMEHPNIARVLDGGTTDAGRPYFVMELVKGKTITEYCDANKLGVRHRLELHATVCQAVQHAHNKGVIHRDLKPSNIMITLHDGKPFVKVIDFGVSKALNQQLTERTLFTAYGQMVGTPQYMSPEQAEMSGLDVDTRSDIYSLGVLLYELLTGSTPLNAAQLRSASYADIQRMIRDQDPPKPSTRVSTTGEELTILADHRSETPQRLHQLIRGDLDLIVMKALEKDRTRRYDTAAGFANDIERYLNDEPVKACPPSVTYRMWKFYRRNRGLVTAGLLLTVMMVVAVAGTTTGWIRAMAVSEQLVVQADQLVRKSEELEEEKDKALTGQQRERALRQQAEKDRERAEEERKKAERNLYIAQMQLAHQALGRLHAGTVEETLEQWTPAPGQPDYRNWEWYYLLSESRKDLVWTLHDHILPVLNVAWSNDDRRFASVGADGVVRIWDVTTGKEIASLPKTNSNPHHLRWSLDGSTIATGHLDGTIHLWDGESYAAKGVLPVHPSGEGFMVRVVALSFSQDGARLASFGWDLTVRVWDVHTHTQIASREFPHSSEDPSSLDETNHPVDAALSPDGRLVAAMTRSECRVWDVSSAEEVLDLSEHVTSGRCLAWSPDGLKIALGGGYDWFPNFVVTIVDSHTGAILRTLRGHKEAVESIDWNHSGDRVVTSSWDRTIRIWSVNDAEESRLLQGHSRRISDVCWSPDGRHILSGADDGTVRIWSADADRKQRPFVDEHRAAKRAVAWHPDGGSVASVALDAVIRVWDVKSRQCITTIGDSMGQVLSISWSPDGSRVAAVINELFTGVWDARSGEHLLTIEGHKAKDYDVDWSPDGSQLVTTGWDGFVRIWDATTGRQIRELPGEGHPAIRSVTWSPDGRYTACVSPEHFRVWESTTGEVVSTSTFPFAASQGITFCPQGDKIACSHGHDVTIFDVRSASALRTLRGHTADVMDIAWNPVEMCLATASHDGTIRIWDAVSGQQALVLTEHADSVLSIAWRPDGKALASADVDGSLRIWDASRGYHLLEDAAFVDGQTTRKYRQAQDLSQQGRHDAASHLLTDVLKWKPENATILWERAAVYARLGDWRRAGEDLSRISELEPDNPFARCGAALACLQIQDVDSYLRLCRQLLALAKEAQPETMQSTLAAWTCLVAPHLTKDLPDVNRVIERSYQASIKSTERRWFVRFVDQRRGNHAPEPLAADTPFSPLMRAEDALMESIRLIQLGEHESARHEYEIARRLVESHRDLVRGDDWWFLATCEILSRELERQFQ